MRLLLSNIRGINSKSESWEQIMASKQVTIGLLNETNVHGKMKIRMKNYCSFTKNNPKKKSMGGLCSMVKKELQQSTVRVSECSDGILLSD